MDEDLVLLVKQYPPLYDLTHKDYDNNIVKERIWKGIGEQLCKPYDECKNKWTLLRSYFVRSRARRRATTGQPGKKMRKWRLEDQMQFLIPFLQSRENRPSMENISGDDECDKDEEEMILPIKQESPTFTRSIPSPAPSVRSRSSRSSSREEMDRGPSSSTASRYLETTLSEFTQKGEPSNLPIPEKKRKLMTFFEDIAESMMIFPELDVAEVKSEIFTIVNKREIEILKRQQRNTAT